MPFIKNITHADIVFNELRNRKEKKEKPTYLNELKQVFITLINLAYFISLIWCMIYSDYVDNHLYSLWLITTPFYIAFISYINKKKQSTEL